jgi:beta-glucosidase
MSTQARYQNPALSISERVDDLLQQMTLEEKVAQLGSYWVYELLDNITFSPDKASNLIRQGVGQITRLAGASDLRPAQAATIANQIQQYLLENSRLRIPAVIHEECCSGYMAYGATVFPQAIGLASSWEPELLEAVADVIRVQMRSVGAHQALSPVLDVTRDARWGRVEETCGEDPYLVALLGTAYIKGMQGSDPAQGVLATAKHFVGYGMSEGGMNWAPPHFGWREMREVYLFPFEAAVREAKLASVMNGYHELDGVPCGASRELMTDILRGEWGFEGTVVSDYFAVAMLESYHHVTQSKSEAASTALDAGIDVELPSTDCYSHPLIEAVKQGRLAESVIDVSVRRVLAQKFELGLFEKPFVDVNSVDFDTPQQRQLARTSAQKSIVLLKNENNLLPLQKNIGRIAVIGPNAANVRNLFGDYSYPAHVESLLENKKNNVFNTSLPDAVESADDFIVTNHILDAIKAKASTSTIDYAQGCDVIGESTEGFAEAVEIARKANVAIVVVGDKAGLTDDCTSGEARDRAELSLPGVQGQLVKAIYETGTPVVLVLINGRPVTFDWMADSIPAIVEAWFPGEEGANAVADVLFGDVNPGGKLPISFPVSVGQIPVYYGHRPSGGRSHWKGDYVETSTKPLYPFGYGLSYTRFEFGNLRLNSNRASIDDQIVVEVDVTNVGDRTGDEVAQLYVRLEGTSVTRPVKELKGFKRLTLDAGQTKTVTFTLPVNSLGYFDKQQRYVVEPCTVDVMIGNSSQDIFGSSKVEIQGSTTDISSKKVFFSGVQ